MKKIPTRLFGSTGHESSRALFGAAALWKVDQAVADRTLDLVAQWGVNHIDTANSYGEAEKRLGPWLKHNRKSVFLATKTEERSYQGAREHLYRSLELLNTDYLDLWQLHILVDPQEWETAMGPGGALEAFVEAREQGLVKYLGVTGHGLTAPSMHLKSLQRFPFDSVLLPWNWTMSRNPSYAKDFRLLQKTCQERNTALQLIKTACRRSKREEDQERWTCWYEPLSNQDQMTAAVHHAMGIEEAFINTVGDVNILPLVLKAAADYQQPPSEEEMARWAAEGGWEALF